MKKIIILIAAVFTIASCSKKIHNPKDYGYTEPQSLNDGLVVKNVSSYNIDKGKLEKLNKDLIDQELNNVHSVLIYKDDALFYEKYLCGRDQKHGKKLGVVKHDAFTLHDARSVSKSVVSACIGIAVQKGLIGSLNDPISNYLCEANKSTITIKELLTMSSGLSWKEMGDYNKILNDESKMDLSFHPIKFVLEKDKVAEPGTTWNYSGGSTQLLAEIIRRTSGQDVIQFSRENLLQPLQIYSSEWIKLVASKDPAAASGLRLTSRSLLKFGILYCNEGKFNGQQILADNWVSASITSQMERPSLNNFKLKDGGYGYQFWTYDYVVNNHLLKIAEAKGNGGQSIFICQELNIVVVITAGNYGEVKYNDIPHRILNDYILQAIL